MRKLLPLLLLLTTIQTVPANAWPGTNHECWPYLQPYVVGDPNFFWNKVGIPDTLWNHDDKWRSNWRHHWNAFTAWAPWLKNRVHGEKVIWHNGEVACLRPLSVSELRAAESEIDQSGKLWLLDYQRLEQPLSHWPWLLGILTLLALLYKFGRDSDRRIREGVKAQVSAERAVNFIADIEGRAVAEMRQRPKNPAELWRAAGLYEGSCLGVQSRLSEMARQVEHLAVDGNNLTINGLLWVSFPPNSVFEFDCAQWIVDVVGKGTTTGYGTVRLRNLGDDNVILEINTLLRDDPVETDLGDTAVIMLAGKTT